MSCKQERGRPETISSRISAPLFELRRGYQQYIPPTLRTQQSRLYVGGIAA